MNPIRFYDLQESFELLIFVCSLVLLAFLILVFILFTVFQKRKIKFITERNEAILRYQEEVARTQLEIQEATLKNVSWELHDNIGQLLSVANLELNILTNTPTYRDEEPLIEIKGLIGKSLQEIRSLSRNLNREVINQIGLIESTKNELNRLERLKILDTTLNTSGAIWQPPQDDALILFRIIQEFLNNVIKHAKASLLNIDFEFSEHEILIKAEDNGIGFDINLIAVSSGLVNMKSRAALINAEYSLHSVKEKGTVLIIRYLKRT
ncbi:sensor histidine kinase [Leeuwenhoekiella polynyae]|uniref:Uncharacterized protein n=1 Tax=Leeuwenhoekiella polynyae TaxID=1550906 RepID=A0A4Q0P726_9FLAO|nr:ATP-binding protein [Leeuwenhoekiella polynyae]RXG22241.1 hypothetical protein DSM02_1840 [Leeuwenhoekiella polynyae]